MSRFKYEPSGEIEDLAAKPSLLKSVSQILQVKMRRLVNTLCIHAHAK